MHTRLGGIFAAALMLSAIAVTSAAGQGDGTGGGTGDGGGGRGGDEQLTCFGQAPTIRGSGELDGTEGDDVILGSQGADRIRAFGGNDLICAGDGDDRIGGGPGNDVIGGGPGNDQIDGGPGTDDIRGGKGNDAIRCGTGDDTADGGPDTNTAETQGFETCEKVSNANPPASSEPAKKPLKATLTPRQVIPRPTGAKRALGKFTGTLTPTGSGATVVWRLRLSGLSSRVRSARIHRGAPGSNGPVILRLCAPCPRRSGTRELTGQPARMAILRGNAYVIVTTVRNRKGEVRGQIAKVAG